MQHSETDYTSTINFTPQSSGYINCVVENDHGYEGASGRLIVNDLNDLLAVWTSTPIPVADERLSIVCAGSSAMYEDIRLYKDGDLVDVSKGDLVDVSKGLFLFLFTNGWLNSDLIKS